MKLAPVIKYLRLVTIMALVASWAMPGDLVLWGRWPSVFRVPSALAGNTGALTAGGNAAVTSNAGDNNGFQTTPTNTTSDNTAYAIDTNSGSAASTSCATSNTASDRHDFTTFGVSIPAGSIVKGIEVTMNAKYDNTSGTNTFCSFLTYDGGSNWTAGQNSADIGSSDTTFTLGSATDLWGRASWTATELNNTNFKIRIMMLVANTNRDASLDYLAITVHYSTYPAQPSQDSPSSGATGVSLTPTFTMTATDPDSDNVGYKVAIYSNSGCSTVVQENSQATSSTGWTGTNATCTAAPTSCYTSATQGSFLTQTALSLNTQYWWRAKAFDPDGSTYTRDSSTCNAFTTLNATGAFDVYASSSASFDNSLAVLFTSQTSTMTKVGALKLVDDRGSTPGWTLNITGTDWKAGQDVMQLDYDGTGSDGNLGKMCVNPNAGTLYAEVGSTTGVSKGTQDCFSTGVSAIDVLTATNSNGHGTYWLTDASLSQFIPGNPTATVYTTTIIFTLSYDNRAQPVKI